MASRAPNTPKIDIAPNAYIIVRPNMKWSLLFNFGRGNQPLKALKLNYLPDSDANIKKAVALGKDIYFNSVERLEAGLPVSELTVMNCCDLLLAEGRDRQKRNEKLGRDEYEVIDGRGYWNYTYLNAVETHIERVILPYWSKAPRNKKPISRLTRDDITDWQIWRRDTFPDYAPSSIKKQNITFRHLQKIALRKGESFIPVKVPDEKGTLKERARSEANAEAQARVFAYIEKSYLGAFKSGEIKPWHPYRFFLHCYLELLIYTGIRPWSSKKNALRMDQIKIIEGNRKTGEEIKILITRDAKQPEARTIAAHRNLISTIDKLNRFYEGYGIGVDREYLIVHPHDNGRKKRLQPVQNYNSQWPRVMRELGINDYENDPIYKHIVPYSYRHAYAAQRLREGMLPSRLARQMMTSNQMIEDVYGHYVAEREYEEIVGHDKSYVESCVIFNDAGHPIDRVQTNSEAHWAYWNDGGLRRCAYPPEKQAKEKKK